MMEGNKKSNPRALLVFGAPCSGKSTFAEKFAKKFGLAYFDLDSLMEVNNFNREQMIVILQEILKTKQTIIVEGMLNTESNRTEMRNLMRNNDYAPALIWVQTDVATIRTRLKNRHHSVSKAKKIYENAVKQIEAPSEIEKPIILSGKHTFETQTKHVIKGLAELIDTK